MTLGLWMGVMDYADLERRLLRYGKQGRGSAYDHQNACAEAADAIAALRADNARLREALKTIAAMSAVDGDMATRLQSCINISCAALEAGARMDNRDTQTEQFEAIHRLALTASIGSCTCHTKSPDIHWHQGNCRYVLLQYILAQAEEGIAAARLTPASQDQG